MFKLNYRNGKTFFTDFMKLQIQNIDLQQQHQQQQQQQQRFTTSYKTNSMIPRRALLHLKLIRPCIVENMYLFRVFDFMNHF